MQSHLASTGRIISGGQTGVVTAALDMLLALGVPMGDWFPRRRIIEAGRISAHDSSNSRPIY